MLSLVHSSCFCTRHDSSSCPRAPLQPQQPRATAQHPHCNPHPRGYSPPQGRCLSKCSRGKARFAPHTVALQPRHTRILTHIWPKAAATANVAEATPVHVMHCPFFLQRRFPLVIPAQPSHYVSHNAGSLFDTRRRSQLPPAQQLSRSCTDTQAMPSRHVLARYLCATNRVSGQHQPAGTRLPCCWPPLQGGCPLDRRAGPTPWSGTPGS